MISFYQGLVVALVNGILTEDREEAIYLGKVAQGCAQFLSDEDAEKAADEALKKVEDIMRISKH
mgnify:CR=1 FL=1